MPDTPAGNLTDLDRQILEYDRLLREQAKPAEPATSPVVSPVESTGSEPAPRAPTRPAEPASPTGAKSEVSPQTLGAPQPSTPAVGGAPARAGMGDLRLAEQAAKPKQAHMGDLKRADEQAADIEQVRKDWTQDEFKKLKGEDVYSGSHIPSMGLTPEESAVAFNVGMLAPGQAPKPVDDMTLNPETNAELQRGYQLGLIPPTAATVAEREENERKYLETLKSAREKVTAYKMAVSRAQATYIDNALKKTAAVVESNGVLPKLPRTADEPVPLSVDQKTGKVTWNATETLDILTGRLRDKIARDAGYTSWIDVADEMAARNGFPYYSGADEQTKAEIAKIQRDMDQQAYKQASDELFRMANIGSNLNILDTDPERFNADAALDTTQVALLRAILQPTTAKIIKPSSRYGSMSLPAEDYDPESAGEYAFRVLFDAPTAIGVASAKKWQDSGFYDDVWAGDFGNAAVKAVENVTGVMSPADREKVIETVRDNPMFAEYMASEALRAADTLEWSDTQREAAVLAAGGIGFLTLDITAPTSLDFGLPVFGKMLEYAKSPSRVYGPIVKDFRPAIDTDDYDTFMRKLYARRPEMAVMGEQFAAMDNNIRQQVAGQIREMVNISDESRAKAIERAEKAGVSPDEVNKELALKGKELDDKVAKFRTIVADRWLVREQLKEVEKYEGWRIEAAQRANDEFDETTKLRADLDNSRRAHEAQHQTEFDELNQATTDWDSARSSHKAANEQIKALGQARIDELADLKREEELQRQLLNDPQYAPGARQALRDIADYRKNHITGPQSVYNQRMMAARAVRDNAATIMKQAEAVYKSAMQRAAGPLKVHADIVKRIEKADQHLADLTEAMGVIGIKPGETLDSARIAEMLKANIEILNARIEKYKLDANFKGEFARLRELEAAVKAKWSANTAELKANAWRQTMHDFFDAVEKGYMEARPPQANTRRMVDALGKSIVDIQQNRVDIDAKQFMAGLRARYGDDLVNQFMGTQGELSAIVRRMDASVGRASLNANEADRLNSELHLLMERTRERMDPNYVNRAIVEALETARKYDASLSPSDVMNGVLRRIGRIFGTNDLTYNKILAWIRNYDPLRAKHGDMSDEVGRALKAGTNSAHQVESELIAAKDAKWQQLDEVIRDQIKSRFGLDPEVNPNVKREAEVIAAIVQYIDTHVPTPYMGGQSFMNTASVDTMWQRFRRMVLSDSRYVKNQEAVDEYLKVADAAPQINPMHLGADYAPGGDDTAYGLGSWTMYNFARTNPDAIVAVTPMANLLPLDLATILKNIGNDIPKGTVYHIAGSDEELYHILGKPITDEYRDAAAFHFTDAHGIDHMVFNRHNVLNLPRAFAHEALHVVTAHRIKALQQLVDTGKATDQQSELWRRGLDLLEYVRRDLKTKPELVEFYNHVVNMDELIAYGLSNEKFMRYLKDTRYGESLTYTGGLFNAFVDFIRTVLGLGPESETALGELIGYVGDLRQDQTITDLSHIVRKTGSIDTTEVGFKNWFKDSKVVDANGKPLVMYHGTQAMSPGIGLEADTEFTEFRRYSHFGDSDTANEFATSKQLESGDEPIEHGRMYPVYLSIQNPLRITDSGGYHDLVTLKRDIVSALAKTGVPRAKLDTMFKYSTVDAMLREHGYDGLVYKNIVEGPGTDSWIIIDPGQVKSATANRGTFDPNNPDIRFMAKDTQAGTTFQTAKGSKYTLHADGTTTRVKGHDDIGLKERSQTTFFVSEDDANKLGIFQTKGGFSQKHIRVAGDEAAVFGTDTAGKVVGLGTSRVRIGTKPFVGAIPVELWDDGKTVHFGNKITSISSGNVKVQPIPAEPPRAAFEDGYPLMEAIARAWIPQVRTQISAAQMEQLYNIASRALLENAKNNGTFLDFMERMKLETYKSFKDTDMPITHAMSFAAIAVAHGALLENVSNAMVRAAGGQISAGQLADMNNLMAGKYGVVENPKAAIEGWNRLGIPVTMGHVKPGDKEIKIPVAAIGIGKMDGGELIATSAMLQRLENQLPRVIKEGDPRNVNFREGKIGQRIFEKLGNFWKHSTVTGMIFPDIAQLKMNYVGNLAQIHFTAGATTAGRNAIQSLPYYIPGANAINDWISRQSHRLSGVPVLGSITNAMFNPLIGDIWSGKIGTLRLKDGTLLTYEGIRQRLNEDGILDTFVSEEFTTVYTRRMESAGSVLSYVPDMLSGWFRHIEQRQRTALYLDLLYNGASREEARRITLESLYDWHSTWSNSEYGLVLSQIPFLRYFTLAARQNLTAFTDPFTKPSYDFFEGMVGQSKLGRVRTQKHIIDKFYGAYVSLDPELQGPAEDLKQQREQMGKYIHPGYTIDNGLLAAYKLPDDKIRALNTVLDRVYTHELYTMPPTTNVDMFNMMFAGMGGMLALGLVATGERDNVSPDWFYNSFVEPGTGLFYPPIREVLDTMYGAYANDPAAVNSGNMMYVYGAEAAMMQRLGMAVRDEEGRVAAPKGNVVALRMAPLLGTEMIPLANDAYYKNPETIRLRQFVHEYNDTKNAMEFADEETRNDLEAKLRKMQQVKWSKGYEAVAGTLINMINARTFYNPQEEQSRRARATGRAISTLEKVAPTPYPEDIYIGGPGADAVREE